MKTFLYEVITGKRRGFPAFLLRGILRLISLFYFAAVKLRLILFNAYVLRSAKLKTPVISVGNITWGGTGKTPLTELICTQFSADKKRVVLLTRGYGGDENKVLSDNMPGVKVLAGANRLRNAQESQDRREADLFVLDDGFQHLLIRRDADIVCIDAANPFGNGFLIPAGILREPVSELKRAGIFVISKSDLTSKDRLSVLKQALKALNPSADIFEAIHEPVYFYKANFEKRQLDFIRSKKVCVLSGLGDNDSFAWTIERLGGSAELKFSYMDHHVYTANELNNVMAECARGGISTVVTTEKDWVKIKKLIPERQAAEFLILKIRFKIADEKIFFDRLRSLLAR